MKKRTIKELDRLSILDFKSFEKTPITIVLDNIRSSHNVGSIFRTSDAFALEHVFLCGITVQPPNVDITKTAIGATDSVNWSYEKQTIDAINKLKKRGYQIWAIEQVHRSQILNKMEIEQLFFPIGLVFGHEVKGVSQQVIDQCHGVIEIPQYGTKHSLNISVSMGIVVHHMHYLQTKIKSKNE